MKIAIIGNSHFGTILAKQLSKFDTENEYVFYNTYESTIDKVKYIINLLHIDIVYCLSASIRGGLALKLASFSGKKIVQHFIGSDVLTVIEDYNNKVYSSDLLNNSSYLCEIDWIQDELKEIGINAEIVSIMAYEEKNEPKEFINFSVLTYIGQNRAEFYGINSFIKLANDFPDVVFKIAGIESYPNLPVNIKCLGWVNMIEELQKSTIFIRNAEHDGLGFSIIEALSVGRQVFYNYNFPYIHYFKSYNDLSTKLKLVFMRFKENKLKINFEAIEYIHKEFNKEKVLKNLVLAIQK